jgi:DNA modification methylase
MMDERKLTKEDIDRVRDIEGFPIAKDEDIIALSRPPYYTACPNPFIEDFIREHGTPYDEETDDYHREPFAADVSEGKNDPIYNAHSYHTKVPHKAIMRYILHYTNPGDIVFDGFCGTGMTGVAAQMCGNADAEFKLKIDTEMPYVKWGTRNAILSDLSPAATFIAYNYNTPIDVVKFQKEAEHILAKCEKECGWMYETQHVVAGKTQIGIDKKPIIGKINYIVWSDVFVCPSCSREIIFWDAAVDKENGEVKDKFTCRHCSSELTKRDCAWSQETHFDTKLKEAISMAKQVPVLINYSVGKKRFEKTLDENDFVLIDKITNMEIPYWYPTDRMCEGIESRRNDKNGITHIHQFYTRRALSVFATFNNYVDMSKMLWLLTSTTEGSSKLNRERPNGLPSKLSGTLYVSSMIREINVIEFIKRKVKKFIASVNRIHTNNIISAQSCTDLTNLADNTIDYIFTDPPFGGNLNYSELNFLWEAWLKVITNPKTEAVMNRVQGKGLPEYQKLMEKCFSEYYRVLKPGRWMTVEFHNSQNSVWNTITEALLRAGFVVADVRTLDKKQSSFKQVTAASAVKQDLIISMYKPTSAFVDKFEKRAGDPEMAWEFVRQHLQNVPKAPVSTGKIEIVSERQDYLLFDRMVAFHIMRGIPVPMDAHTFYAGLRERFIQRDGMFFLPDQVNEYDERRQKMELKDQQLSLFITDEKSAIIWLNAQLGQARQTYSEIQPKFLQDWHRSKFEQMPELLDMLKENFLCDDDGKWYVPNLSDQADLEKLRRKRLLKDFFDIYAKGTGRIKNARTEAIRVGFDECWKERNYALIVKVGDRLPETVLQEDPALLMYYDNAANRM